MSGVAALVNGAERHSLDRDLTLIGRGDDCDIRVDDPLASRRHAQVRREPSRYVLEDLGSRNGTLVDGEAISGEYHLRHGDTIYIATTALRFEDPNATLPMNRESLRPLHLPVWVNAATGEAYAHGNPIELAPKELTLLTLLYEKSGGICEKDEIAQRVWPEYSGAVSDYNIETLVSRLRSKLNHAGGSGDAIVTVKKRGYRLKSEA